SGGYAIVVDPSGAAVGSLTLTLYDVPADPAYTISPGRAPAPVTTRVPGQNARLAFTGSGGERVSLALSAGSMGLAKVSLLAPDGSTLVSGTYGIRSFPARRSSDLSGGYAIVVDPSGAAVGSLTLTLYDVPADPAY